MSKIYCGKGKEINGKYGAFYKISVCLDEIPAEHIFKAKNGKRYATLNMSMMRQKDDRGIRIPSWLTLGNLQASEPEDFVTTQILYL